MLGSNYELKYFLKMFMQEEKNINNHNVSY